MTPAQAANLSRVDGWFRYWMPYAYVELAHPKRKYVYLPVNRIYKPLGITRSEHVDYQSFLPQAVAFKADPATFTVVWHLTEPHFYLYGDGPASRQTYFDRLRAIMMKVQQMVRPADELAANNQSWDHSGEADSWSPVAADE